MYQTSPPLPSWPDDRPLNVRSIFDRPGAPSTAPRWPRRRGARPTSFPGGREDALTIVSACACALTRPALHVLAPGELMLSGRTPLAEALVVDHLHI